MTSLESEDLEIDIGSKRKREFDDARPSKRSRKQKRNKRHELEEDIDQERAINLALGKMSPDLLADYVARKTKRFEDGATFVELEDRRIPGKACFLYLHVI